MGKRSLKDTRYNPAEGPEMKYYFRALSSRVLAVASINEQVGDWAVYIDAVPGWDHTQEFQEVARMGNKLPKEIAALIFPSEAAMYRWRD
jgi:hypothetical protein